MRNLACYVFAQAVAGAIVFVAIVSAAFLFTREWPPQELLIGSSIGGALSPLCWRTYRRLRRGDEDDTGGERGASAP